MYEDVDCDDWLGMNLLVRCIDLETLLRHYLWTTYCLVAIFSS